MSLVSVRSFLSEKAPDVEIIEMDVSTATVALAAEAYGVQPGQIAKTLALRLGEIFALIVTRGDARLDNKKIKATFGVRARMLSGEEVVEFTGHPVGGVCPFGLLRPMPIYCDISLKAFDEVIPAAGSMRASVRMGTERMAEIVSATWVDVCQEIISEPPALYDTLKTENVP